MKEITLKEGEVFTATEQGIYNHGDGVYIAFGEPLIQYFFMRHEYDNLFELFKKEVDNLKIEKHLLKAQNVPLIVDVEEKKVTETFALEMLRIALNK